MNFFRDILREMRINYYEWQMYRSTGMERVRWWSRMRGEINKRSEGRVGRLERKRGLRGDG